MYRRSFFALVIAGLMAAGAVHAQSVEFSFTTVEDGLRAARETDKLVMVVYYDNIAASIEPGASIWRDPLVQRFVGDFAVPVAIAAGTEEGDAFQKMARKRRRGENGTPGIYFFSNTGRSLGALHGTLRGIEGVGRLMMMLGAAQYAAADGGRSMYRARGY